MGKDYGPYVMYIISQILAKQRGLENREKEEKPEKPLETSQVPGKGAKPFDVPEKNIFAEDETGCLWRREENIDLLKCFCQEGFRMAEKHGHFIVGENPSTGQGYIGIPGRFLLSEQPAGGRTGFSLWQPLKGGENYYDNLEQMGEDVQDYIFGYWIAKLSAQTLELSEA